MWEVEVERVMRQKIFNNSRRSKRGNVRTSDWETLPDVTLENSCM